MKKMTSSDQDINLNIEISNDFASVEKVYSNLATIRLKDFVDASTEELPLKRTDMVIDRLSVKQIEQLAQVLNKYLGAL